MILFGSMLLGLLFVLLGKLNKAYRKEDFAWKIFIRNNMVSFLMNLVASVVLVINQAEVIIILTKIIPSFPFVVGGLSSFICGVAGLVIVQFFVDLFNPAKKTVVGVNK